MGKRAAFIKNKYYADGGIDYVYAALQAELYKRGITLVAESGLYVSYPFNKPNYDFAVFWDKDASLARCLERSGIRVFNSSRTIELCDDKEKTFAAVSGVKMPVTVVSPLCYDVSDGRDEDLINLAESLAYPVVVKERVGSQGRQVYLADSRAELIRLHNKSAHIPHLFQQYISGEKGSDVRVYVIGKKAVAAVKRHNTTDFRSNAAVGGAMSAYTLSGELAAAAERVAECLNLEYGSADFIHSGGEYYFIEANSSPYMQNAKSLNIDLAAIYADYLAEAVQ